jgi:hypothetical protein
MNIPHLVAFLDARQAIQDPLTGAGTRSRTAPGWAPAASRTSGKGMDRAVRRGSR